MHAPTLDLPDIQATILRPWPMRYLGTHVILRIDDARAGREFLRRLTPHVDSAAGWWNAATPWLSVGITYAGLEALGLPRTRCSASQRRSAWGWPPELGNSGTRV